MYLKIRFIRYLTNDSLGVSVKHHIFIHKPYPYILNILSIVNLTAKMNLVYDNKILESKAKLKARKVKLITVI